MTSPYRGLPGRCFWKTAVAERSDEGYPDLWRPKFPIDETMAVATAGSCFAQHIARHLAARNFHVLDVEPPPPGISDDLARRYGWRLFSARYGNIYTARQLLQLAREAFGDARPADIVWEKDGRYYDALRPAVEPGGLATAQEVTDQRAYHLARVAELLARADLLVFTFGLTEAWVRRDDGTVYPTAPGTIAGHYDERVHAFANFGFQEVLADFLAFRRLVRARNRGVRFLLTVSPVPLTATAADAHVLVATTHSKAVLRAVAGELAGRFADVDYFPSYEIVAAPPARARFFADNLRQVTPAGVEAVMAAFFAGLGRDVPAAAGPPPAGGAAARGGADGPDDVVCEEALLEAFAAPGAPR